MKKHIFTILLSLFAVVGLQAQQIVQHLEPLSWWVGMQDPSLQLMLHGPNIGNAQIAISYPGVTVSKINKAESDNYLYVDLTIDASTLPGKMPIAIVLGKKKQTILYELQARKPREGRQMGLSQADVVYLIMPDRFANGDPTHDSKADLAEKANRELPHGRHGGDLQGITNHLDYLADLGVTALWLTPFQTNAMPEYSYHGYAMTDMYHVDPRMGTNDDYKKMVATAHDKGVKVLMDVVFNQVGIKHWWMADLPFHDWINQFDTFTPTNHKGRSIPDTHAAEIDKKIMVEGWFTGDMPDMNQANPFMIKYLTQWTIWWIEFANLDALRFDTYQYNKIPALEQWSHRLYQEYPNIYYCAEVWIGATAPQVFWQKTGNKDDHAQGKFQGQIDFPLYEALCNTLIRGHSVSAIYDILTEDFLYPDPSRNLIFWGNHDTDRFLGMAQGNVNILKMATNIIFTTRGIPQVYYADEILFDGLKSNGGDAEIRHDFPGGWTGDAINGFTTNGLDAKAVAFQSYFRNLLNWRKKNTDVMTGQMLHYAPIDEVYVYFRIAASGKTIMVIVNPAQQAKKIDTSRFSQVTKKFTTAKIILENTELPLNTPIQVPAQSTQIYELR
jgi:glycosidase